ncbi:MAG: ECF transporter S component [Tissierellales bacterium]|nr:ECF transporter S component [Tissierellales bacterium]
MKNGKSVNVRRLTVIGVLGAVSIVLGMTPLGFIPVGPTRATTMHIPVIIGAILEGPIVGALVGLIFGLFSIYQAITAPTPVSPFFLNPLVSVLPRILIGITSYYSYSFFNKIGNEKTIWIMNLIWAGIILYLARGLYLDIINYTSIWSVLINIILIILASAMIYVTTKKLKGKSIDVLISAVIGTLTNTVLVLSMIYLIYGEQFVESIGQDTQFVGRVIAGIGVANGIPETIIAAIVVSSVVTALKRK